MCNVWVLKQRTGSRTHVKKQESNVGPVCETHASYLRFLLLFGVHVIVRFIFLIKQYFLCTIQQILLG